MNKVIPDLFADRILSTHKTDLLFEGFPTKCNSYLGPLSTDCYKTIWKSIGCSEEGRDWPDNLPQFELDALNTLNLR